MLSRVSIFGVLSFVLVGCGSGLQASVPDRARGTLTREDARASRSLLEMSVGYSPEPRIVSNEEYDFLPASSAYMTNWAINHLPAFVRRGEESISGSTIDLEKLSACRKLAGSKEDADKDDAAHPTWAFDCEGLSDELWSTPILVSFQGQASVDDADDEDPNAGWSTASSGTFSIRSDDPTLGYSFEARATLESKESLRRSGRNLRHTADFRGLQTAGYRVTESGEQETFETPALWILL